MPGKKPSRTGESASQRSWELKEIQELIDLLIEREVGEFELEKEGMRIRILRQSPTGAAPIPSFFAGVYFDLRFGDTMWASSQ